MIKKVSEAINNAGIEWAKDNPLDFYDEAPLEVYARATLGAILEPTDAMLEAGSKETNLIKTGTAPDCFMFLPKDKMRLAYQAMIRAALEESK